MFFTGEGRGSGAWEVRRLTIVALAAGAAYAILAARLFQLQIVRGAEMLRQAERNRTQVIPLSAARGRILDRSGEVLMDNAPRFSIFYSNLSVEREDSARVETETVERFPGESSAVSRRFAEARRTGKMTRILAGIPREKAFGLIERRPLMPGLQVVAEPQRHARFSSLACHALGYVDEANAQDLKSARQDIRLGQFVGRSGVEKIYDEGLRGEDGGLQFETDARGRHLKILQRLPARPGNDLRLTLDRRLQSAAEKALEAMPSHRGAVVALDPRDGAVRVLASRPGFDPTGRMAASLADTGLPFFNRALQGVYPPGSVFKIVSAAAALTAGWNTDRRILCTGVVRQGNRDFKCWKRHGVMDFWDAMAWSCDTYYYTIGQEVGPEAMAALARAFGQGSRTGIDLPAEAAGLVPSASWKSRVHRQAWFGGDTLNMSIGQGYVLSTPLQAALLMSAAANGGTVWTPHIADRWLESAGESRDAFEPRALHKIPLEPGVWSAIRRSLEEVVRRGTGGGVFRPDLVIGGKTGTAQNPHGEDHAWFAAYAGLPGEDPSLVVAAFVENGGHGSDAALPVVREVLKEAFPLP